MKQELNQIGFNLDETSVSALVRPVPSSSLFPLSPPFSPFLSQLTHSARFSSSQYPHGLSHYVGMDLHDTPLVSKDAASVSSPPHFFPSRL